MLFMNATTLENVDTIVSLHSLVPVQRKTLRHKVQPSWRQDYVVPTIVQSLIPLY